MYLGNVPDAIWNMFVGMTSSSFPNQFIPMYTDSRLAVFFFVPFSIIGHFVLLNILLVVVLVEFGKASIASNDKKLANSHRF